IYAILLAFAVYFPNSTVYLFFVLPIKTKYIVLLFTAISLLMQISGGGGSVAHLAHLAGFGIAFLYFIIRIGINPITAFKDSRNSPWQ
nr:rhomboid family intramembrane serine protease [Spirochaetaceae bacterium]